MAKYKNIPVDPETYEKVEELARINDRKLGAQIRTMVNAEYQKLGLPIDKPNPHIEQTGEGRHHQVK